MTLYLVCNAVCDLLFKLGSQRDLFMAPVYVYRTRGICVVALTVHNYVCFTSGNTPEFDPCAA